MIKLPLVMYQTSGWALKSGGSKVDWGIVDHYAPGDPIRAIERASIRAYVELHQGKLKGRVLDFGAGTGPYKDLVTGEYVYIDYEDFIEDQEEASFDAFLCTQVIQYTDSYEVFSETCTYLKPGGFLVLTYPTNWDEVEPSDYTRYTRSGMEKEIEGYGLTILDHTRRAEVRIGNFTFPLGYGLVAQRV